MIAVGGENLIDMVQTSESDGLPVYTGIPGGSPYNCAIAIARQAQAVQYLTPISTDALGDKLAARLEADGVDISAPRLTAPSSLAVVSVDDGSPSYQFYREGTAERHVNHHSLMQRLDPRLKFFHVGSLALIDGVDAEAWEQTFIACADEGTVTSLDPNARPLLVKESAPYIARIKRMIARTTVLKLSDEDLEFLMPGLSVIEGLNQLIADHHIPLVVLTKGAQGAIARCNGIEIEVPVTRAEPLADTVGAGDTFMGTILAELSARNLDQPETIAAMDEQRLGDIMNTASRAAAINCERVGCNPPYRAELDA